MIVVTTKGGVMNVSKRIGVSHGVEFDVTFYKTNGFQLRLTDQKTEQVLFDKQMVFYTLPDAIYEAVSKVFADEIEKTKLWELPSNVLIDLGLDLYNDVDEDE
jgi:hypothetical protein